LTGGIGAGKSTVAEGLARRGAIVINGDKVGRELQEPGQPVFLAMVARWGDRIVAPDGSLDRPAMAAIAFGDPDELAALNALTHPAIIEEILHRVRPHEGTDATVVLDVPLLLEMGREHYGVQAVIVVDTPFDVAVTRLVTHRGMTEEDAWARIAAQATREERAAAAELVVDNGGSADDLEREIDRTWAWIAALPPLTTLPIGADGGAS
jgi:dephospho-CoA kinase